MHESFAQLFRKQPAYHIDTRFANEFGNITDTSREKISQRVQRQVHQLSLQKPFRGPCTIIVIGIGHWDAGFPHQYPTPIVHYETNMFHTVDHLHMAYPAARIYVWNVHPMSLGFALWDQCPSYDWRNPALIDQYNYALQRVVKKFNSQSRSSSLPSVSIQYLDTSFIVNPQWDAAVDWYHHDFDREIGQVEAIYIAATIFGIAIAYHQN
jgi:hypothetical protein